MESALDSKVASASSPDSLRETLVAAAAHALELEEMRKDEEKARREELEAQIRTEAEAKRLHAEAEHKRWLEAEEERKRLAEEERLALEAAEGLVFVLVFGLGVAQAQHALRELSKLLEAHGVEVTYAIHPVAGRMPGHMNVLLAEADVPYEQLLEMDTINPEFPRTDVVIVLGANDVVNPDAKSDSTSPL